MNAVHSLLLCFPRCPAEFCFFSTRHLCDFTHPLHAISEFVLGLNSAHIQVKIVHSDYSFRLFIHLLVAAHFLNILSLQIPIMNSEWHDVSSMVACSLRTCITKEGKIWLMMSGKDREGYHIWVSYHQGVWWYQDGQDWRIYAPLPPVPPPIGYAPSRVREHY